MSEENEAKHEVEPTNKRNLLETVLWAAAFIWAGVALLLNTTGLLPGWLDRLAGIPGLGFITRMGVGDIILIGLGLIVLLGVLLRLVVPAWRGSVAGGLILALVLLGFGMEGVLSWKLLLPAVLIILGVIVFLRGFRR